MIKYNWDKILKVTGGDSIQILAIIHVLTYKRIAINRKDPAFKYKAGTFVGGSFLLHPEKLLANHKKYFPEECATYLMVASFRNYFTYKESGDTRLHMIFNPLIKQITNDNRLLQIVDDYIYFRYEENHTGKKLKWQ
jgi:hypothetical protein